jgi:hypothetical protein
MKLMKIVFRVIAAAGMLGAADCVAALVPLNPWAQRDAGAEVHALAARAPTSTHTSTPSQGPTTTTTTTTTTLDISTSVPSPTAPLNATLPPQAPFAPL